MASSNKRPWHIFYFLGGIILLIAFWCGFWFIAFAGAKELVQTNRHALLNQGLRLDCARESWGGFPFRFEFQCETVSLQFTNGGKTHSMHSMKILAVAQAYNPFHILLLIDGPSTVDGIKLTHKRALISIAASSNGNWDMSSDAAAVDATGLFSAAKLKLFARKANGKLDLAVNAEQLVATAPNYPTFSLTTAALIAWTRDVVLRQPFHGLSAELPLEITTLKMSQGPIDFIGQGRIFLDSRHRLAGKLSSQTNDIDGLMKIISPIFAMSEQDSAAIKNLLVLSNGNSSTTEADFVASEGILYWGLFKLAELPPIY